MTYPFVVGPVVGDEAELPAMLEVRQHFDVLPAVDVLAALDDEWPRVLRIFVRGLSGASNGNAKGIGNADAVAVRLVDELDGAKTAVNGLTSCSPDDVRIPLVFACDRDAVFALLTTIRPTTPDDVRVVYVRNTLDVARLWVSAGCLAHLSSAPAVVVDPALRRLPFDAAGNLVSPFTGA